MTVQELNQMLERAAYMIEDLQSQLRSKPAQIMLPGGIDPVVLKGDKGEKGEQGEKGERGDHGEKGNDGMDGNDGLQGARGFQGLNGLDGKDGIDGKNGKNGKDGKDGRSGKNGSDAQVDEESIVKRLLKHVPKSSKREGGGFSMASVNDFMLNQGFVQISKFVYNEVVPGSGTAYQLKTSPVAGTPVIYALGQKLSISKNDYTITSAGSITTTNVWLAGDIEADYVKQ